MSELIRSLKINREEIDPDFIADYSFLLGDFNYRLESNYGELI